jgi:hypothetical protein
MAQTYEPEDDQLVAIRGLGFSSSSSEGTTLDAKAAITNFKKGEDCFECVRDIQRYLRRDTPERPFHLRLSQLRVLPMRLLPLAVGPASVGKKRLQLAVIKLLVTMTMPLTDEFDAKLRAAHPDIVMDHRQSNHQWGAWSQAAGSYSEPIAGDENPESYGSKGVSGVTTLSTDHVLANNLRVVNSVYRGRQLLPNSRIPGFMSHQVRRSHTLSLTLSRAHTPRACSDDVLLLLPTVLTSSFCGDRLLLHTSLLRSPAPSTH